MLFCFLFFVFFPPLGFRHTELEIAVPDIGIVGLHAENLGIGSVLVDGEAAEFEYYPHQYHEGSEKGLSAVLTPSLAADAAASAYITALERELVPNLLINCCKGFKNGSEQQPVTENGFHSSAEAKQQVIVSICVETRHGEWFLNAGLCLAID